MSQNEIETSPLVLRIKRTLDQGSLKGHVLRVSVSEAPQWEKSSNGEEVLVRWLCWSVDDGEVEVVPPEFEVVGKDVTSQRLEQDFKMIFQDMKVVVDNDIDI